MGLFDAVYDYFTGEGVKGQYDVQAKQYDFLAADSKRQMGILAEEGGLEIGNLVDQGKGSLSSALNLASALGGVGFKVNDVPGVGDTGIDVGESTSKDVRDLLSQKDDLATHRTETELAIEQAKTELEEAKKALENLGTDYRVDGSENRWKSDELQYDVDSANIELAKLTANLDKTNKRDADLQERIDTITSVTDGVGDIELSDAAKFASGSTLANLATMRDKFQQARNTYVRGVETDIYTYMLQGENYDAQAAATRRAGESAKWDTILGNGMNIVGLFV